MGSQVQNRWVVVFVLAALLWSPKVAVGKDFQISKISVCTNTLKDKLSPCNEVRGAFDKLDRRIFSNSRMHIMVVIEGGNEALSVLDEDGELPVKVAVWRDGDRKPGDISIGIKQDDWDTDGLALQTAVDADGKFRWRTRFWVNVKKAKTVEIEINDALNHTALKTALAQITQANQQIAAATKQATDLDAALTQVANILSLVAQGLSIFAGA